MNGIRADASLYSQVIVEAPTFAEAAGHILGWCTEHEESVAIIRVELEQEMGYVTGAIRFSER